jgi:hypothetical protein
MHKSITEPGFLMDNRDEYSNDCSLRLLFAVLLDSIALLYIIIIRIRRFLTAFVDVRRHALMRVNAAELNIFIIILIFILRMSKYTSTRVKIRRRT